MCLYLIELYIAGVLLINLLTDKLPCVIQSVSGILAGYLLFVLNSMGLIAVGIGLSQTSIVILTSVECLGFLIGLFVNQKKDRKIKNIFSLNFWIVGLIYFSLLYLFYELNLNYVTHDSIYLILFGRDLIQSGFSEWYIASPASMGIYIPLIQAMGMLFGLDYVWFIQPVLSVIMITVIIYFGYKSVIRYIIKKWIAYALVVGAILLFLTANLIYGMLVYTHTNLSSALYLFLTVVSFYFAIEDDNGGWLVLGGLSLISFGLVRIENPLIALIIIFLYLSSGKLSQRQSILTFIPYLLFQGVWYFSVYLMDIETFLSGMGDGQILLISLACFAMILVILLRRWQLLKRVMDWASKSLPFIFLAFWGVLGALNPSVFLNNLKAILTNFFISGGWGFFWVINIPLLFISIYSEHFPQKRLLLRFLISFFAVIEILGFFRYPYHDQWYDSANRMMIHIAPLVLFFVITQVAKASSLSKALPEVDETPKVV